jgi:hypothetical protein
MLDLNSKRFRDQIMGCWMGKNCGGTLGTPLEKAFGEKEPFNISWYPKLEPGGMPNDDLEMQLIWLKALEEVGPGLTARELAQYWVDHIGYNWDEYGLSKTNLLLGLLPPASGAYNNWFVDCMGCPIRSEIWACIAPGAPRLAVKYAYEDAITDHAGGESVWGELFNTAMESAAFIESDMEKLLNIGRSYVPNGTKTARAIDAARMAHRQGLTWKEARTAVLRATPHYVAQYSPINMGFQVIGLLYGKGFGHTLCLTVNCGYDTDCTGATVGAILGIINGYSRLPEKWTAPLGKGLATNASWGGIKHVYEGDNPIPRDIDELTDRTIVVSKKIMTGVTASCAGLMADAGVRKLTNINPMSVFYASPEHPVRIEYGADPVIAPHETKTITTIIDNPHPEQRSLQCRLYAPDGWQVTPRTQSIALAPGKSSKLTWKVRARAGAIRNTNRLTFFMEEAGKPACPAVPIVLVGARALLVSQAYAADKEKPLETMCAPEKKTGSCRNGKWTAVSGRGNQLPDRAVSGKGIVYVRAFLKTEKALSAFIKVEAECPYRAWLDGKLLSERAVAGLVRPAQHRGGGNPLKKGWHEIMLKLVLTGRTKPQAHIIWTEGNDLGDGLIAAEWTMAGK